MQNTWLKLNFAGIALIMVLLAAAIARGTLADGGALEPGGPPAPGMKSLQEVEPRTPISSLPFAITQPGSYYLTQNVATSTGGITVTASDVSIDLNGFRISGNGVANIGIDAGSGVNRLTVRNGTISEWLYYGIAHVGGEGRFEDLKLVGNEDTGLYMYSTSVAHNVIATANLTGIWIDGNASTLSESVAANNAVVGIFVSGDYNRIESNNVVANGTGIHLAVLAGNNAVVRNTATVNPTNFQDDGTANFIPVQTSPTVTNPWSNVNY